MGNGVAATVTRRVTSLFVALVVFIAGCAGPASSPAATAKPAGAAGGGTTLEFSQWWEPELPQGALRGLMDQFEAANPGIKVKLLSGPFASTKEQTVAGAAAGTMADVVGLDGAWVSDFVKQGSITNLTALMKSAGYDDSQLAAQIKVSGSTYMIPVVNFIYPLFTNDDLLAQAGVSAPPTNRTEFMDAAKKISARGGEIKGWILPLSLETPNGVQNDVMAWNWAAGGSMLKDGKPDLANTDVRATVNYVKSLWDAGVVAPGAFTMKEQDKVEEFTNGRVGMMIGSLAWVNLIRKNNPNLKFSISAIPARDGFSGKRGIPYASWGIGVAENSKNKAEAWKLVDFLMNKTNNASVSSLANGFPGNTQAVPSFVANDTLFKTAFDIYKAGYPANEFTGLPVADELMRSFDEQLQKTLNGNQSVDDMLKAAQTAWLAKF